MAGRVERPTFLKQGGVMRFCVFMLMCTGYGFSATDLVIPWVTNNAQFRSTIIINNLNASEVSVTLQATRANGSSDNAQLTIAGLQQVVANVGDLFTNFGDGAGYAVNISSESDGVRTNFIVRGTGSASGDSPAQTNAIEPSDAANHLLFGYTPAGDNVLSAPVVVNPGESSAAVTFYAYHNGQRHQAATINVPAGAPYADLVGNLFPQLSGDMFLVASSDQPVLGTVFTFNSALEPSMTNAESINALPTAQTSASLVLTNGII